MHVDLLVPVKLLDRAKTRLLRTVDGRVIPTAAHTRLALALVRDTLRAAAGAATVRRLVVICSDELVRTRLAEDGIETVPDEPGSGLNAALRHGEDLLRRQRSGAAAIGALLADLPALRPGELDCAVHAGLATGCRAFCTDRPGTGTTLLLAPAPHRLDPRFGPGSAAAHRGSGAQELTGRWPGLRCDVDTMDDLAVANGLGLGRCTRAALAANMRRVDRLDHRDGVAW